MKSVPANAIIVELSRNWKSRSGFGNRIVKSSIETSNLRNPRVGAPCPFNQLKREGDMKRREMNAFMQFLKDRGCNPLMSD